MSPYLIVIFKIMGKWWHTNFACWTHCLLHTVYKFPKTFGEWKYTKCNGLNIQLTTNCQNEGKESLCYSYVFPNLYVWIPYIYIMQSHAWETNLSASRYIGNMKDKRNKHVNYIIWLGLEFSTACQFKCQM